MYLTAEKSLCKKRQAKVVSKDKKQTRIHRAINPGKKFELRHYRLDGEIVENETCCDFLLINDSTQKAYFIELKGKNIDQAISQLEAGKKKFESELHGYSFYFRIVCSKAPTHKVRSTEFRKFQEKYGIRLQMKERELEEILA